MCLNHYKTTHPPTVNLFENPREPDFNTKIPVHIEITPVYTEIPHPKSRTTTRTITSPRNIYFPTTMAHIHYSQFTYGPSSPYYIPTYNHNQSLPPEYIHPNSAATQLGLTPTEMAPILQEQHELMQDELAQPPNRTTIYHNHTRAESPQPPLKPALYVHPQSGHGSVN
jgi:hypothetical protein